VLSPTVAVLVLGPGVAAAHVACARATFIVPGFWRWVKGQAQGMEPGGFKRLGQLDSTDLYSPLPTPAVSVTAFCLPKPSYTMTRSPRE
jgi:hypothetical protein